MSGLEWVDDCVVSFVVEYGMELFGFEGVEGFSLDGRERLFLGSELHVGLLHLLPGLSLMEDRVAMGEGEVGELVIHFVLVVALLFKHTLVFEGFVGLDEVELLLSLIIANLLLIDDHLVPEVVEEFVVLHPLFGLEYIVFLFVLMYLVDYRLQELLLVARSGIELHPLGEPLSSPPLDERTQEGVGHSLLSHSCLFLLLLALLLLSLRRNVVLPHTVLQPALRLVEESLFAAGGRARRECSTLAYLGLGCANTQVLHVTALYRHNPPSS